MNVPFSEKRRNYFFIKKTEAFLPQGIDDRTKRPNDPNAALAEQRIYSNLPEIPGSDVTKCWPWGGLDDAVMPEGGSRWASGGTRRKSKGVEDLYTSCARDAPQKKLWVRMMYPRIKEMTIKLFRQDSVGSPLCDTINIPYLYRYLIWKIRHSCYHNIHSYIVCGSLLLLCATVTSHAPACESRTAKHTVSSCASFDVFVLAPVCSNQDNIDGSSRRGQELPHQKILRREGEQKRNKVDTVREQALVSHVRTYVRTY